MSRSDVERAVHADVADVLVRYASGIDRRDWVLFGTCFTDDCEADYGDIGTWHNVEEITRFMTSAHEQCRHTLHRITNVSVDRVDEGNASARCYVDAMVLGPEGQGGVRAIGFYDDDLLRTDRGWRIARRKYTMVHLEPVGEGVTL